MQNWEVVKKKISKMSKEEFIKFVNCANNYNIHYYADLCDAKKECYKIDCNTRCKDCVIDLLEEEYQPPKQEKWIVHRTLRRKKKEIYFGIDNDMDKTKKIMFGGYATTYNPNKAILFSEESAIQIRDKLNKSRQGKRYLWVISKVEE